MNSRFAILSAIPAELIGFPDEEFESQILYTGVGKINATKAIMKHAVHLKEWNYSVINYGTAAKVCPNVDVGKLYEVTNFIQRDMDVTPGGWGGDAKGGGGGDNTWGDVKGDGGELGGRGIRKKKKEKVAIHEGRREIE